MGRFTGKRIMITGGTSGIGLATALRIVEEGGEVGVSGTTQAHLDAAGKQLPSASLVVESDAGDPEAAKAFAEHVRDSMGPLDGLFLNAGFGKFAPVDAVTADFIDAQFDVNVRGMMLHMAHLKPALKDGAAVLLTSSVAPYLGQGEGAAYAATKGAVTALGRAWARALAPAIRVNTLSPGPVDTNFFEGADMSEEDVEAFSQGVRKQVPLGRFGTPEEMAAVAAFLLSDESSFVTGSEYVADGGMTMR